MSAARVEEAFAMSREALATSRRAEEKATHANDHALSGFQGIGELTAAVGGVAGKVDALIGDHRELRAALRELPRIRDKLDTLSELERIVSPLERQRATSARRMRTLVKWGKRCALAFVVAIFTVAGGAAGVAALSHLGIHVRTPIEVSP